MQRVVHIGQCVDDRRSPRVGCELEDVRVPKYAREHYVVKSPEHSGRVSESLILPELNVLLACTKAKTYKDCQRP